MKEKRKLCLQETGNSIKYGARSNRLEKLTLLLQDLTKHILNEY